MICSNCGRNIEQGKSHCEYCGLSVDESILQNEAVNDRLSKRFAQIDIAKGLEEYGFDTDYDAMSNKELRAFLDKIQRRLDFDEQNNRYNSEQLAIIIDHVTNVDEALQTRLPIRPQCNVPLPSCKTTSEAIRKVLSWEVPEIYMAGAKIRSSVERQLKEYYNCHIEHEKNDWYSLFHSALRDDKSARKCAKYHRILNWFIHSDVKNDESIKRFCAYDNVPNAKELLLKVLKYYQSKNMIYEKISKL